jgi:hypothetical protein
LLPCLTRTAPQEPAQEWELFEGGTPSGWQLTPAFRLSCLPPDATVDEARAFAAALLDRLARC